MSNLEKNKPKRRRRTASRQDLASLQDGEELYEALGDDPAYQEVNSPSYIHHSDEFLKLLSHFSRLI